MPSAKLKAFIRVLTGLIGLAIFGYTFLYFVWEATKLDRSHSSGTAQSEARFQDSVLVFRRVDTSDFAEPPYPKVGDTLVKLFDSLAFAEQFERFADSPESSGGTLQAFDATREAWARVADRPRPVGNRIPFVFRSNGELRTNVLILRPPKSHMLLLILVLEVLRFLIALFFLLVALWAFFKRPDSAGVRALALFCFSMAAFMISSVHVLGAEWATFNIPYQSVLSQILNNFSVFFGAFWLNLHLLFPRPLKFVERHPVLAYSLCYVPTLLLIGAEFIRELTGLSYTVESVFLIVLSLQFGTGFTILSVRNSRAADWVEKRQTRLVLWSSAAGLGLLFIIIFLSQLFRSWFQADQTRVLILINVAFLGLMLTPLSFAYAFGRYRLLEVEAKLRRGTRYVLATGFMLALMLALGYALGSIVKTNVEGGSTLAVVVAIALAAGFPTFVRRGSRLLADWFYPERKRLREMLTDFLQRTATLADKDTFWRQLEERLSDGLRVEGVHPLVRKGQNGRFLRADGSHSPFHEASPLIMTLEQEQKPVMVDEILAGARVPLHPDEQQWLSEHRVALMVPLVMHSRLVGVLGLGSKREREDYAAEELRILGSLAPQVAIASENIRLLEENVDKRRLDEQMQMARRIQHGFLPQVLPETPGLEVAARSRFCLEVAGDYYDVIPLENGSTVLSVADVSGKGAGAALLMANLQASLRTAVGIGTSLGEIVSRINDLIYRNTPPEQFITFFVGIYEPHSRRFTYVNAGHNPPMLIRRGKGISNHCAVETLNVGGVILGTLPGMPYTAETVEMNPGDMLLMYTDGVSEAMNGQGEEFGEHRIEEIVTRCRETSLDEILALLENEVLSFHGSDQLEDDFTLLLMRVK